MEGAATFTEYFCNSIQEQATLMLYSTYTTDDSPASTSGGAASSFSFYTPPVAVVTTSQSAAPTSSNAAVTTSPVTPGPTSKPHSDGGAIAGGVIGALAILAALAGGTILALRRRKMAQRKQTHMEISQAPH